MLRESARECNFFAITRGHSLPERHPNSRNCKTGRSRRTRRQNLPWRYGDWRRIEKQSWMNPVTQGAVDLPHLLVRQEAEKSRADRERYSREKALVRWHTCPGLIAIAERKKQCSGNPPLNWIIRAEAQPKDLSESHAKQVCNRPPKLSMQEQDRLHRPSMDRLEKP